MKVVELKDIVKKDMAIDYRRIYTATAVLELADTTVDKKIEMVLEHTPLSEVEIRVTMLDELDYPLLPVLNEIKEAARILKQEGKIY